MPNYNFYEPPEEQDETEQEEAEQEESLLCLEPSQHKDGQKVPTNDVDRDEEEPTLFKILNEGASDMDSDDDPIDNKQIADNDEEDNQE